MDLRNLSRQPLYVREEEELRGGSLVEIYVSPIEKVNEKLLTNLCCYQTQGEVYKPL